MTIAHRLSTVQVTNSLARIKSKLTFSNAWFFSIFFVFQNMDRIFVLAHGRVVESGSHGQLLATPGGVYAKLWSKQGGVARKSSR